MYRIIKAQSKDGTDKLESIKVTHSLEGYFWSMPFVGAPFYFEYDDNSGKMMRSSIIQSITTVNSQIRITTMNSEYWFEEVE